MKAPKISVSYFRRKQKKGKTHRLKEEFCYIIYNNSVKIKPYPFDFQVTKNNIFLLELLICRQKGGTQGQKLEKLEGIPFFR